MAWKKIQRIIVPRFKQLTQGAYKISLPYSAKPDIICFPVIDWEFRFQRPQQILTQFAHSGYRIFYVTTRFVNSNNNEKVFLRTIKKNIWNLTLPGDDSINMYKDILIGNALLRVEKKLPEFFHENNVAEIICIVNHPFWTPLVEILKKLYGWKIVYDCMDLHNAFDNARADTDLTEKQLVSFCDLVITSSKSLYEKLSLENTNCVLIPNAGDYVHFSQILFHNKSPLEKLQRPIIGYYGSIAEWFDAEPVYDAALNHPEWSFALIGHTFGADIEKLRRLSNVHFLGEKPYEELPYYVVNFDVCIIPFKDTPLTRATNPVKVYEYLAAGKPIVSRDLPELKALSDVIYLYSNEDEFVKLLEKALRENSSIFEERRRVIAHKNTWEMRFNAIKSNINALYEKVSIIVVTWNNLEYTKECIQSVLMDQTWPNYEIIVVDNASSDGTQEYLRLLEEKETCVKAIYNSNNLGFATANNIGIQQLHQDSKYIVLLNNDTIVSYGWLSRLLRHARTPEVGMVGPVTNFAGNEAKIDAFYSDINIFASTIAKEKQQQNFDIPMLAMYCVVLRKEVFDLVGPLDESFGIGMFEDDDYSERVRQAGFRVVCAEDVFIHHYGKASFNKLTETEYTNLFEHNKILFEKKWGKAWKPHQHRL